MFSRFFKDNVLKSGVSLQRTRTREPRLPAQPPRTAPGLHHPHRMGRGAHRLTPWCVFQERNLYFYFICFTQSPGPEGQRPPWKRDFPRSRPSSCFALLPSGHLGTWYLRSESALWDPDPVPSLHAARWPQDPRAEHGFPPRPAVRAD